jgi:MFS family permease
LATVLAGSFALLLVGRLILGIGGTLIITASPAAIAQWFRREELGKAMGIFAINMPFATIIAFPTASALMLAYGWRFPFHISLGVSAVAAVFYFAVVKTGPYVKREKPASMREAFRNREIWKVGIVWLFFNAAALSFTTWAPTLLGKYKGMPEIQSGFLASLFMWSAIFCVPVYGYLSDETGRRKLFAQIGFLLMSLSFVALAFTSDLALVASILALGITAAMIPPIVSTLSAEILGPSLAGIGFGINNTCANVGASLAQPFVGFLLGLPEPYMLSLFVMAAFAAIGAVAAYTLKTK